MVFIYWWSHRLHLLSHERYVNIPQWYLFIFFLFVLCFLSILVCKTVTWSRCNESSACRKKYGARETAIIHLNLYISQKLKPLQCFIKDCLQLTPSARYTFNTWNTPTAIPHNTHSNINYCSLFSCFTHQLIDPRWSLSAKEI